MLSLVVRARKHKLPDTLRCPMIREADRKRKRAVVAAVQKPRVSDVGFDASLAELRQLAKTLSFEVVATFTQKRASFDSAGYFGPGKRKELSEVVQHSAGLATRRKTPAANSAGARSQIG